ncbi:hypothetical protein B0H34DRAFT_409503 [Crassisporium funariophilum]|nr:hypothetical protein B0H34DRAFT_409503 [Crassisporium funariophilum]
MVSTSKDSKRAIDPTPDVTIENAVDQAKRAFALKKYEQAIDHYATALELITKQFGENAPETADLYFSYGKALLENAIVQSSVLGKDQPEDAPEDDNKASGSGVGGNGPILSFSGDAEDMDDGDDRAVDLFGQAAGEEDDDEERDGEDEGDDAEPEDDFNAAWEVLDLARAIYDKQREETGDEEVMLKLADTYIALGDVSLETEKFDQAITDYECGLELKTGLLPTSSRHIAEAHYKLSMVLDLTSGRLADAIVHAEKAHESVESRLAELRDGLSGQLPPLPAEATKDAKGKGKSSGRLVRDDYVQNMTKTQIENEVKELTGLKDDLALKVEELKTSPNDALATSAPALVAQALDRELNAGSSSTDKKPTVVNDLTSMVTKKKKKVPVDSNVAKRKADGEAEQLIDKKPKLDSPKQ